MRHVAHCFCQFLPLTFIIFCKLSASYDRVRFMIIGVCISFLLLTISVAGEDVVPLVV